MTDTAASPPPHPSDDGRPVAPPTLLTSARPAARFRTGAAPSGRRTVRHVEVRSVARVSAVFYACAFVVLLIAGVALWIVAAAAGVVGNVESFVGDLFALDEFRFEPFRILQAAFVGGVVLVLLGTALNVLATLLFNAIADTVGGVELTVVDDERVEPARRSVV